MNITVGFPPNYDEIVKHFPVKGKESVVFTYGDTMYLPYGGTPSPDLIKHEMTHTHQQKKIVGGAEAWWKKYMEDAEFRSDRNRILLAPSTSIPISPERSPESSRIPTLF